MKKSTLILMLPLLLLFAACATTTTDTMATGPGAHPAGDVAGIVLAANEGEIAQGNAAAGQATSAEVRSFAQMMVTDHTNALNMARDTFSRHNMTPGETDITRALRTNSDRTVTNLATYRGRDFDRTYMQTQVNLHQWLLTTLDTALIPSAPNADVRSLLQTQRGSVAAHLEQARAILGRL